MPEFSENIWAPWRMEYIRSASEEHSDIGCFLCHYWSHPEKDHCNHVLWRGTHGFVFLNRFPYSNGHLLVAPAMHTPDLDALPEEALGEWSRLIRDAARVLRVALDPGGFNIGCNIGRCAGAGVPDHLHAHVVPRWNADTNFMAVVGDTRVIPEGLDATRERLLAAARKLQLPVADERPS